MSQLEFLPEDDVVFQERVHLKRLRTERHTILTSIAFLIHTLLVFIALNYTWINDKQKNDEKIPLYIGICAENVIFSLFILYLFNKFKFQ